MSYLGGISPITVELTDTLLQLVQAIKPGLPVEARVTGSGAQRHINLAGTRIPLPTSTTLAHGDPVTVQIVSQPDGSKVIITPGAQSASSSGSGIPNSAPAAVLQTLLQEIPGLQSLSAQQATALSPASLPSVAAILRLALDVLQVHTIATASEARETLVRLLRGVASNGKLSETAQRVLALLGQGVDLKQPDAIEGLVRLIHDQAQRAPLAAIHAAATQGVSPGANLDAQSSGLYHLLALIRNDSGVLSLLGGDAEIQNFRSAVDVLQDQSAGQHLQNARSSDVPYVFLNLPLGSDIQRAQLHVLGRESSGGENGKGEGSVILDLQLSNLGNVWMEMKHRDDSCVCRFHVESDSVAGVILDASEALTERLRKGHFSDVSVQATTEQHDRFSALVDLLAPLSGLDISA